MDTNCPCMMVILMTNELINTIQCTPRLNLMPHMLNSKYQPFSAIAVTSVIGETRFPLYFGIEIQGLFSTEVYSMDSITATINIYFCKYGTVLVGENKTSQLLANLVLGKIRV